MSLPFQAILVPQGQEYQAVYRAVQALNSNLQVIPIPMGNPNFAKQLEKCLKNYSFSQAILLGLCGSLSAKYRVGDILIYQICKTEDDQKRSLPTNTFLTDSITQKLGNTAVLVNGLSCDRLICAAQIKKQLAKNHQVSAVDMESYQVLAEFDRRNISLAIIRVVSDGVDFDLPDLSNANLNGALIGSKLAIAMISQPYRSFQLIKNALKGLKSLEDCTRLILS